MRPVELNDSREVRETLVSNQELVATTAHNVVAHFSVLTREGGKGRGGLGLGGRGGRRGGGRKGGREGGGETPPTLNTHTPQPNPTQHGNEVHHYIHNKLISRYNL